MSLNYIGLPCVRVVMMELFSCDCFSLLFHALGFVFHCYVSTLLMYVVGRFPFSPALPSFGFVVVTTVVSDLAGES